MPDACVAAHGSFRLRKRADGTAYVSHLSYLFFSGEGRVVEENIIEQFYSVEDGLQGILRFKKEKR